MGFSVAGGMWTMTQQTSQRPVRSRFVDQQRALLDGWCRQNEEIEGQTGQGRDLGSPRYFGASPCKTL